MATLAPGGLARPVFRPFICLRKRTRIRPRWTRRFEAFWLRLTSNVLFLAGYMKKLGPLVLRAFERRILNPHPALLPRFGGPGMYGDRVFEAVLEAGEAESGVSIHLVEADYDTGAMLRQCRVPVCRGDSLDDLKARVRAREKEFVVETLGQIAKGEIRLVASAG